MAIVTAQNPVGAPAGIGQPRPLPGHAHQPAHHIIDLLLKQLGQKND